MTKIVQLITLRPGPFAGSLAGSLSLSLCLIALYCYNQRLKFHESNECALSVQVQEATARFILKCGPTIRRRGEEASSEEGVACQRNGQKVPRSCHLTVDSIRFWLRFWQEEQLTSSSFFWYYSVRWQSPARQSIYRYVVIQIPPFLLHFECKLIQFHPLHRQQDVVFTRTQLVRCPYSIGICDRFSRSRSLLPCWVGWRIHCDCSQSHQIPNICK